MVYDSASAFNLDAMRLANEGWEIVAVDYRPLPGRVWRLPVLNFIAKVRRPRDESTVEYRRGVQES